MTIINTQHKFIYLKSAKSAGTSVEAHLLLNTLLGGDIWTTGTDILKYGLPAEGRRVVLGVAGPRLITAGRMSFLGRAWPWRWQLHLKEHHHAKGLRNYLGGFWDLAFKATNVRNPWDLMVSAWQWRRDGRDGRAAPIDLEFHEWVTAALSGDPERCARAGAYDPWRLLHPFIFVDGTCVVDLLIRQEAIDVGLAQIGQHLGLDLGTIQIRAKTSRRRPDYRPYYTDSIAEAVGAHFADIIVLTGYKFDPDR